MPQTKRKGNDQQPSTQQTKHIKSEPIGMNWITAPHHLLNLIWHHFMPVPSSWEKLSNPEILACTNSFPLYWKSPRDYWHLHKKKSHLFYNCDEDDNHEDSDDVDGRNEMENRIFPFDYPKKFRNYNAEFVQIVDPNTKSTNVSVPRQCTKHPFNPILPLRLVCKHWKESIDTRFTIFKNTVQLRKIVDGLIEKFSTLNQNQSVEFLGVLYEQVRILQHQYFVYDHAHKYFSTHFAHQWNTDTQKAVKSLIEQMDVLNFQRQRGSYDGDVFSTIQITIPTKQFQQTFTLKFNSGWNSRDIGWDTEVILRIDKGVLLQWRCYRASVEDEPHVVNTKELQELSKQIWPTGNIPPKMTCALLLMLCGLSHWDLFYIPLEKKQQEENDEEDSEVDEAEAKYGDRYTIFKEVPEMITIQKEFREQVRQLIKDIESNLISSPLRSKLTAVAFFLMLKQINNKQIEIGNPHPIIQDQQLATNVKSIKMKTFLETFVDPGEYSGINSERCSFKIHLSGMPESAITVYLIQTHSYYGISGPVDAHKAYLKVNDSEMAQKLEIPVGCYVLLWSYFFGSEEWTRLKMDLMLLDKLASVIGWNTKTNLLCSKFTRQFCVSEEVKMTDEQKSLCMFLIGCARNPRLPLVRYKPQGALSEDEYEDDGDRYHKYFEEDEE